MMSDLDTGISRPNLLVPGPAQFATRVQVGTGRDDGWHIRHPQMSSVSKPETPLV
jgi:hypothetical protein